MLLALTAGLLGTLYGTLYRLIENDIDRSTSLMLRGALQISVMTAIIVANKIKISPKNMEDKTTMHCLQIWFIGICVGILGGLRLWAIFAALESIPMGLFHTILNGAPILVNIEKIF